MLVHRAHGTVQRRIQLVLVAGTTLAIGLSGCAAESTGEATSASNMSVSGTAVTTVSGELVANVEAAQSDWDGWCAREHSREGARVTISDGSGNTVGLGSLSKPAARNMDGESKGTMGQGVVSGECVSSYSVDVTSASDFFTIKVEGVNGAIDVTRAELIAGPALKLP